MAQLPLRACQIPYCNGLATHHGYCERHAREREQRYEQGRGTPAVRGYDARWARRRRQFLREHPTCVLCGRPAMHVHHRIALRDGGDASDENLLALCHSCHSSVTIKQRIGRSKSLDSNGL